MATRIGCYTGKLYDSSVDVSTIQECCQILNWKEPVFENEEAAFVAREHIEYDEGLQ